MQAYYHTQQLTLQSHVAQEAAPAPTSPMIMWHVKQTTRTVNRRPELGALLSLPPLEMDHPGHHRSVHRACQSSVAPVNS